MTHKIARAIALAALAVAAGWAQVTTNCTPTTLPELVGANVNVTCAPSGGLGPYTWNFTGALPPGLSQDPTSGSITGQLTNPAGPYNFTVVATDSTPPPLGPLSGSQPYSGATVDPLTVSCTLSTGPQEVAVPYSNSCTATGGTKPYNWSLTGTAVPPSLAVTPTGNPATVSGTPASSGSYQYSVVATDSSSPKVLSKAQQFTGMIAPPVTIATTSSSLPPAAVGSSYSDQFTATGGVIPYTWTATGLAGSGLGMSASGVLQGIPAATGSVSFMVTVTDGAGGMNTGSFTLTVTTALKISTASPLPAATVGTSYTQTFSATGGSGSGYTWSATGLPAWLAMSSGGVLSGSPPASAVTSTFTVKVTDSNGNSTSGSFTLPVTLSITTASSLPAATIGTSYNQTLAAVGGAPPYQWTVSSGTLPAGLSLSSTTGAIAGTPHATAVNASFSVKVTDSNNTSASASFTLPVTISIVPPPLPPATIGTLYSQTFAAEGGAGGYTWSATGLPSWLTLSTAGVLKGTPPVTALDAIFSVTVTDSAKGTASAQFTVLVALSITTATPLPPATVSTPYSQTFAASGGSGGYTWSAANLPAWLTMSAAGVLSGAPPATPTTSTFTVQVTDSNNASASGSFTLQVNLPALTITTSGLANGAIGAQYNQTLTGTGGMPPYTWSLAANSSPLPTGLTLVSNSSGTGTIGGQPSKAGTFTFTVQLSDSAAPPDTTTKTFSITISAGLTITTAPALPNATVGVPYSQTLTAAGGVPPYAWSPAGPLPAPLAALSLNASTGAITGTPSAAASASSFPVTVTDSTGITAKQTFMLAIVTPPVIATMSLPNGTAGVNYSQSLTASGGTPPYQWTILSGSLPSGLSLSSNGGITGTPGVTGAFSFTVQLTDATGVTAKEALTLTVISGLTILTPSPLPRGEVSVSYSQTLAAAGGTPPYAWSVTGGTTVPAGLILAANGLLSGLPSAAGTFTFTVQATDSNHVTASTMLTLTIAAPVSISTPAALNGGSMSSSYSQALAASPGVGPYTWALTTGPLPPGLNLSATGVISGTPTAVGTFPFTAKVADSLGATASRQFTIVISSGLSISTPPTLPGAIIGVLYSESLQASGGVAPYTWNNPAGSPPPGFTVRATGDLTGVTTAAGTYSFTLQVTDSLGHQASEQMSLTVSAPLTITTSALPAGTTGAAYSQSLAATGGTPPYQWSLPGGSLPGGLALSTGGSIAGTAKAAGTFSFTVQVTDSAALVATKQLSITVTGGFSITTPASLPNGSLNVSYSQTLAAAGGAPPYTWTLTAGALPAGLALSSAGAITGAPTAAGTFQFMATATDSAKATATQQFTLIVGGLTISTTALPGGKVGTSYNQTLTATGGTPPYTFATSAGSLPPGITLTGAVLSGAPTQTGSYTFTILVTDSVSATATQQFTIAITGLGITTTGLPSAAVGTPYSQTLSASGTAPYTWAITQGTLPGGLTLDASTGIISGTPTGAGSSSVTIQVTDSTHATASAAFTLTVISASFSGLSDTAASAQQLSGTLALGAPYPQPITGNVTLSFQPDASLASPADDPAIQFSTSGRTAGFTIPANSTTPFSFSLQTGTVAGTITLTVSWQAGGAALPSPAALTQIIRIAPAVPVISAVGATTNSSGFQVTVTGYSNTRDASQAILQFTPASGQTLQTTSLTVSLTSAATSWFQSSASDQYGSQFILTLPFTVSSGGASAIGSISVQLVNSQGTSNSASAGL
jgi:hypothetical protein